MHCKLLAALVAVACLLTACGFVPPLPPQPKDTARIPINRGDPRMLAMAGTAALSFPMPQEPSTGRNPAAVGEHLAPSLSAIETEPSVVDVATSDPGDATTRAGMSSGATGLASPDATIDPQLVAAVDLTVGTESEQTEAEPEVVEPPPPPPRMWRIDVSDGTVRQALARWAREDGWLFGPDQWRVSWDLPIEAGAEFQEETFEDATRALAEAVALSESPIRPCFYANRVLRVIPYNQACDRTTSHMTRP